MADLETTCICQGNLGYLLSPRWGGVLYIIYLYSYSKYTYNALITTLLHHEQ